MTSYIVSAVAILIAIGALLFVRNVAADSARDIAKTRTDCEAVIAGIQRETSAKFNFQAKKIAHLEELLTLRPEEPVENIPPAFQPVPVLQPNPAIAESWAAEREKHAVGSPKYIAFTQRLAALGYGA